MEVTPEGLFARDEDGNLIIILGLTPAPEDPVKILEALQQQETNHRASLISFLTQDMSELLERWKELGSPDGYILASLELYPPTNCSDGVERTMADYILFLTERSIQDWFVDINTKVSGISLAPSIPMGSVQIWVYSF